MQQLQAAESSENIKTRRACDAWLHRGNPSFRSWRGYGRILALARNISHLEGVHPLALVIEVHHQMHGFLLLSSHTVQPECHTPDESRSCPNTLLTRLCFQSWTDFYARPCRAASRRPVSFLFQMQLTAIRRIVVFATM